MKKRILITGGTGLIGKRIVSELCSQGAFVKILTRDISKVKSMFPKNFTIEAYNLDDYKTPLLLKKIIEETDVIINLAGANVGEKRWTEEFKSEIYNSRIDITKLLVDAVKLSENKPECIITSIGVGIYGFRGDEIINEDSESGDDFLANVCVDWEAEAMKASEYGVRVVSLRTGIVLDKNEGALPKLLMPFKFFIGAYQGDGKQWFSWIHIDDIVNMLLFIIENENISGAINGTSPEPVTNKMLAEEIGKIKNTKLLIPVPSVILKIAVGEFAENLLTGQKVIPVKAVKNGFEYKYPVLKEALLDLIKK